MPDFGGEPTAFEPPRSARPTVIMVHGAFCGGWCFDDFRLEFERAGYRVETPDLPGHGPGATDAAVRGLSMRDYARAIAEHIRACDAPPILIGHSLGGLVAQLAAVQAPVASLVMLAPSPAWGQPIATPVEAAAAFGLYGYGAYWLEAIQPEWNLCRALTLDRLSTPAARAIYARMVPESGRALFEVLNWWLDLSAATFIPPLGVRAPVLGVTGEHDRIHSPGTVQAAVARLGGAFREAKGLSHWTMGEPGSGEVAAAVLDWLADLEAKKARVEGAFD